MSNPNNQMNPLMLMAQQIQMFAAAQQMIQAQAAVAAVQSQQPQISMAKQPPSQQQLQQQMAINQIMLMNPLMNAIPPWMNNNFQQQLQLRYSSTMNCFSPSSSEEKKVIPKVNNKTALILHDWFDAHINDPYPSPEDKIMLRDKTGFTDTQIGDWFRNRRRNVKKSLNGHTVWEAPPTGRKRRSDSFFANDSNTSSDSIPSTPTPSSTPILSSLLKPAAANTTLNSTLSSSTSNDQNTSTDDSSDLIDVVTVDSNSLSLPENVEGENSPPKEKRQKLWSVNDIIE